MQILLNLQAVNPPLMQSLCSKPIPLSNKQCTLLGIIKQSSTKKMRLQLVRASVVSIAILKNSPIVKLYSLSESAVIQFSGLADDRLRGTSTSALYENNLAHALMGLAFSNNCGESSVRE